MDANARSAKIMAGARDALSYVRLEDDPRLIEPSIGSRSAGVVAVHLAGARWALPGRVHIAPRRDCLYVLDGGAVHVLIARHGRMRELVVPADVADRIRVEVFDA